MIFIILKKRITMSQVFECFHRDYPPSLVYRSVRFIELSETGEECEEERVINEFLRPFNTTVWNELRSSYKIALIEKSWPWAHIFFPEEYKLAGHLLEIRERSTDATFSYYSKPSVPLLQD